MKNFKTKIASILLSLVMVAGVGVISNQGTNKVMAENTFAPVNTVLWGESFDHFGTKTPSAAGTGTGTTIYDGASITYNQSSTNTKGYDDKLAGGTAPELLLSKSNQTWTISGIKSGGAKKINLTFLSNKTTFGLTCSSASYTVSGSTIDWTLTLGGTAPGTFDITLTNTGSSNARIDNVVLKVTEAGGGKSVDTVTLQGSMTKKTYNTVEAWSNDGLTASGTYDDQTPYTGPFTWSYEPETPAKAVKENGDVITEGSVTVTASAEGKSDDNTTEGINITYATVAQGLAAIPNANDKVEGVIVKGIISSITSVDLSFGNATYYISDDGTSTNTLQIYRGLGLNNQKFTSKNDIKVGDTVIIYGDLNFYNGTSKQFSQGNYLLSLDSPVPTEPTITIDNAPFTMDVTDEPVTVTATALNVPEGGSVVWESSNTDVATVGLVEDVYKVTAVGVGTTEITAKIVDSLGAILDSDNIEVKVFASPINDGETFVIKSTYGNSEKTYYLTGVTSNLGTYSLDKADAMVFTALEAEDETGVFEFVNDSDENLYYKGTGNNLYLGTSTEGIHWTVKSDGTTTVIENNDVAGRKLQFNYNSGNCIFACYTSNQTPVSIEKYIKPEVDEVILAGDENIDGNNQLFVESEFLYEVVYSDVQGAGGVQVTIVNSSLEEEGATITAGPSDGSFTVKFTASDTYLVTVTAKDDETKFDSLSVTVTNIYVPVVQNYALYQGTKAGDGKILTEGDYIFGTDIKQSGITSTYSMTTTIEKNKSAHRVVDSENDIITTDATDIVWHIAPKGEYFTIYNAAVEKYIGGNGSASQVGLYDEEDDKGSILWTISITTQGNFTIQNKRNSEAGVSSQLRDGGSAYACYTTASSPALHLYKKAYTAKAYCEMFNNMVGSICDSTGVNTNMTTLKANWEALDIEYVALDATVKAEIVDANNDVIVQRCLSAYDYIVGKYNGGQQISEITDFMARDPLPIASNETLLENASNNQNVLIIVITISMVSLVGFGVCLRSRKKRKLSK